MSYLLTDRLPDAVSIGGIPFEVETDFRLFVTFERDAFLDEFDPYKTLNCFYKGAIPRDINEAMAGFIAFYKRGSFDPIDSSGKPNYIVSKNKKIPYAFDVDDRRIYSAFRNVYGIDLATEDMHWFVFRSLLDGLCDSDFGSIVGYRVSDLSGLPKEEKKYRQKLQVAYEVKRNGEKELTVEQRDAELIEWAKSMKEKAEGGG